MTEPRAWTPDEDEVLCDAWADRGLRDDAMTSYCQKHGVRRAAVEIHRRLEALDFFIPRPEAQPFIPARGSGARKVAPIPMGYITPETRAAMLALAKRDLANEIARARMEANSAPPFEMPDAEIARYLERSH